MVQKEWFGVGSVCPGFVINGVVYLAHRVDHANSESIESTVTLFRLYIRQLNNKSILYIMDSQIDINEQFDKLKKKKKKKLKHKKTANPVVSTRSREYSYIELLGRVKHHMRSTEEKIIVPVPSISYYAKKTIISNFYSICKKLNRKERHIMTFIMNETGSTASLTPVGALIIRGKYNQSNIEELISQYICIYVLCNSCRSSRTHIHHVNRLTFVKCEICHTNHSVPAVEQSIKKIKL